MCAQKLEEKIIKTKAFQSNPQNLITYQQKKWIMTTSELMIFEMSSKY